MKDASTKVVSVSYTLTVNTPDVFPGEVFDDFSVKVYEVPDSSGYCLRIHV